MLKAMQQMKNVWISHISWKTRLDISYESFYSETIHMKCQAMFLGKVLQTKIIKILSLYISIQYLKCWCPNPDWPVFLCTLIKSVYSNFCKAVIKQDNCASWFRYAQLTFVVQYLLACCGLFNLYHSMSKSSRRHIDIFLIFPRK